MPSPAQAQPLRADRVPGFRILELLHESPPRIIYRARRERDGREVVLKTLSAHYPRKRDVAELRREHRIVGRLALPGVIEVYGLHEYGVGNLAIEMQHFGLSLADAATRREGRPLPLLEALRIATELTRIVGRIHQSEIVHKDLVPRNILIDPSDNSLRIIDFGISSELRRERQDAALSKRLEGSLPYISPEQTGRMNRDVDHRSDYYTLGVTIFELLTGRLPFDAETPLEWVHRHISQPPPLAHEVDDTVPEILGRIVAKLMAKNAEDRYQSSFGLHADLERCLAQLEAGELPEVFELGAHDVSRSFQIPQKLYGRESQLGYLSALFDDVAHGSMGLCLISGPAGVGKSALAHELSKSIARERGYLISGKFDQFAQSTAFAAFASAFRGLVRQIMGEPASRLERWRERLDAALGANAGLLVDLVPELEWLLGEVPAVPELPPTEAQNRFQIVFLNFVKVFADAAHPLVIFMDDLQWSDTPTLHLITRLVSARELNHLLLIGAYRDNQVDASHPLRLTLDEIEKQRELVDLRLEPLPPDPVVSLVAETLHCPPERARPLAELVHQKSRGNPFFINELLRTLHERGAIAFEAESGRWHWELDAVRAAELGENVVDFMVGNLRRLEEASQAVLKLAACIGNSFDLETLAVIHERSAEATAAALHEPLLRGLVLPMSESYRFVGVEAEDEDELRIHAAHAPEDTSFVNPLYRFSHDRVQQAAYTLIDEARRREVHLSIGRLIREHSDAEVLEARLMEVVGHLNAGRRLIDAPAERLDLAELNLAAATKAQRSSAYASALGFAEIGAELLPEDAWETHYELALALAREEQQCAYLTGDYARAERASDGLLAAVRTPLEKAEVLADRTRQYATIGKMRESIRAAIEGLQMMGVEVSGDPDAAMVQAEREAVAVNLDGRAIADLIDAPAMDDPRDKVVIRLLMEIFPAAFLSGSGALFPYLVLKSVNMSLRHGTGPESAFAYAAYGMLLCGSLGDPALGFEFGRMAVEMNERLEDIALKSRVIYVYAMFVHHWSRHWSSMTPWFLKGVEAGYQSGDLLYLAYSAQDCIIWDPKLDLDVAAKEQRKYLQIVKDCEYQDSYDSGTLFLQMQLNFLGETKGRFSLNDDDFDEDRCVEGMRARAFMTGIANFHIYKTEIHVLYGDAVGAYAHVREQDQLIASAMSLPQLVRYRIAAFLTLSALLGDPSGEIEVPADTRTRLESDLAQMEGWAAHCAENFAHLAAMMRGELARLDGDLRGALGEFETAISSASTHGFRRDEAMANELAAKLLLDAGLDKAAEGYLRAAHYLYYRWGARRKVAQLEELHPTLLRVEVDPRERKAKTYSFTSTTGTMNSEALDMASVMKASQVISGEIVLDQLWRTTLQILLENAGGQFGYFVVRRDGELEVQARCTVPGSQMPSFGAGQPEFPVSIINNVLRTGEPVVLDDATRSGRFSADPYVEAHKPRSVLCVPMRRHGQFEGAIYMENNLTTDAFAAERVEIIRLLSAQAAISMENAELYEDQLRLTEAQQRFVPSQFLENLGHTDIARVDLGQYVAREMSVMFADLRDFTPLAERLGPRAMIELLNRYFGYLGEPISAAGGFIDSYNGDEIMALFGGSADRAVRAGIDMCRALDRFNEASVAEGGPELAMGVGLNTGSLVLGTVGNRERLKCGVVGDTVNLASRIEQLTKHYRVRFLIGEQTHDAMRDKEGVELRRIDRVAVKGKHRAVDLYEVLDAERPERRRAKLATRELLRQGLEHYRRRNFEGAAEVFAEAAQRDPEDAVFELFAGRCARYIETPPPADWGGYEALTRK